MAKAKKNQTAGQNSDLEAKLFAATHIIQTQAEIITKLSDERQKADAEKAAGPVYVVSGPTAKYLACLYDDCVNSGRSVSSDVDFWQAVRETGVPVSINNTAVVMWVNGNAVFRLSPPEDIAGGAVFV